MCQVELLELLIHFISADPNCLELSPNDDLLLINPTVDKPFLEEFGNIINQTEFTVTSAQPLKGSALSSSDVNFIEVIEGGSVIKRSGLTAFSTNAWAATYVGGDLVITFDNPVGDTGAPTWVSIKGFVSGKMCL